MKFAIVQYTNLTEEQNGWINELSNEMESFFENQNYGNDLNELYFGLITVKPEFDQFFKKRKPRYKQGETTSKVDGFEIKTNNCAEIDCKLEFNEVSELKRNELIEKVCGELLIESDCLTRLSKLKHFDFKSFKSDFENYMIKKKYRKE